MTDNAKTASTSSQLVIWRFADGKPGHENQTLGLVNALGRARRVSTYQVPVGAGWRSWLSLLRSGFRPSQSAPKPDLLIGAGHATHWPMLACRRVHGGEAVVLMRPTLPLSWFDLSLIPAHDGVAPAGNVLVTRGVLNGVRPAEQKDPDLGLILIGGPSRHFDWDSEALCKQVRNLTEQQPTNWLIATSRRTPAATVQQLEEACARTVRVVPPDRVPPGWLAEQMAKAPVIWVTEDSVSMLYEALTANAACGLLPVPSRHTGRVAAGIKTLLDGGVVCSYQDWLNGRRPQPPAEPFDEATRCAQRILDTWFAN